MSRRAFTLVEILVVLLILAAVAGVAVTMTSGQGQDAAQKATDVSLVRIREAILGGAEGPGYKSDRPDGRLPATVADLLRMPAMDQAFDPVSKLGWRGPYLRQQGATYTVQGTFTIAYGTTGDPAVLDGWGNPIVLQIPTSGADQDQNELNARLVSAGPDGVIQCAATSLTPADLDASGRGDDRVLFLSVADTP